MVIAAAGSGERLGAGGPKAFVPVAGRPMIEWSLYAFRACGSVRSIVVAVPSGHAHSLGEGGEVVDGQPGASGLAVVDGGATRAQSVANALEVVETELVAIHDAARPLLTSELIEDLVACLDADPEAAGVIAAASVTDTIKAASSGELPNRAFSPHQGEKSQLEVERTLDRSRLWAAQTPQIFRAAALRAALDVDKTTRDAATDEAMLVEAAGGIVLIHPSSPQNLKVTTLLDLRVAELLLGERAAGSVPEE